MVADLPQLERPRTKELATFLDAIEVDGKVLILTHNVNALLHLSGRNLPYVAVRPFGGESAYDVVWSGTVVIEDAALGEYLEDDDA